MRSVIFCFLAVLLFSSETTQAQKWNRRPWDGIVALGTTNFMGDLGGGSGNAAHFMGIKDFDFAATRPVLQLGVRYKFHDRWSAKLDFSGGLLGGDDANSGSAGRESRNLHFRSFFYENSLQFEFYFLREEVAARYRFSSAQGWSNISAYLFTGIGYLFYNPQAEYDGKWYNLQKLGTEGQGIGNNKGFYSRWTYVVPMGLGLKYSIDRFWSVGAEFTLRYSGSDYIDDASGSYYNIDAIRNKYGVVAAALADRNKDPYHLNEQGEYYPYITNETPDAYAPPRGNSDYNDAYIFVTFNLTYRFRYGILGAFSGKGKAKY